MDIETTYVEKFILSLPANETAKVLRTLDLLERFGNELGMPHSRHMKNGVLELRIRGTREIRILYCFHNNTAVLLHAFVKKTQKTPEKALQRAVAVQKRLR